MPSRASHDSHAHVFGRTAEKGVNRAQQFVAHRVALCRAVQSQNRDAVLYIDFQDVFWMGHLASVIVLDGNCYTQ